MKVELTDINPIRKKLAVVVDAATVDAVIKSTFDSIKSEAEVEGFRKGKVPEDIIKQRYGVRVMDDVASKLVQDSYPDAVVKNELKPTGKPEIDVQNLKEGEDFNYTAFIDVVPTLDLTGYKELKLKGINVSVDDAEVDDSLEKIREGRGEFVEVDRAAKDDDMVTVDFEPRIKGVLVTGGSMKGYTFKIEGAARFPEFEEIVVGLKVGESGCFDKSFPMGYHDKNLEGKVAEFKVTLRSVKERSMPELNDAFAKGIGCGDVTGLKVKVKEQILKSKVRNERDRLKGEAMDLILESNPFDVPDTLIDRYYNQITGSVLEGVRRGMANPRDVNLSSDEFKMRYHKMALNKAKGDIVLDVVADVEKVKVTEAEIGEAIRDLATSRGQSPDDVNSMLEKEGAMEVLVDGLMKEKAFDVILDAASIETSAEEESAKD
jgi:trigger factor